MEKINVTTGEIRINFPNLFEPNTRLDSEKPKYDVVVLVDKNDQATIDKIQKAFDQTVAENKSMLGKTKVKSPLRDGDEERSEHEAFAGCYFLTAKTLFAPKVVDVYGRKLSESNVKSGDYGRIAMHPYPYSFNTSKGVAWGLNGFMKTKDGEPFGGDGAGSVQDMFGDFIQKAPEQPDFENTDIDDDDDLPF